jgi:hypothetical protein
MEKMSTNAASGWFFLGIVWFLLWVAIAMWAPWSSKVTPSQTAKTFFSSAQYEILYPPPGKPKFDPQNPSPKFALTDPQKKQLTKWGFNDCVQTDGTAAQATGLFDGVCFCENAPAVRAVFDKGFAVQPSNTLSTFSLSLVGLTILAFLVFSDPPSESNFMSVTYFFALCYAAMTIILGPFSMMLHLGLRDWGGWFDSLSLFIWFGFVACYSFFRFIVSCTGNTPESCPSWPRYVFLGFWVAFIVVPAGLTTPGGVMDATWWYLILGGLALLGELLLWIRNLAIGDSTNYVRSPATSWAPAGAAGWWSNLPWDTGGRTWFLAGGLTFALALAIWLLSFTRKPLCAPDSWFQGHAIFHTLSAIAAGFLYKYYRHEGEA